MSTNDESTTEPDDAGDHEVPADLSELAEILDWQAAVIAAEQSDEAS